MPSESPRSSQNEPLRLASLAPRMREIRLSGQFECRMMAPMIDLAARSLRQ